MLEQEHALLSIERVHSDHLLDAAYGLVDAQLFAQIVGGSIPFWGAEAAHSRPVGQCGIEAMAAGGAGVATPSAFAGRGSRRCSRLKGRRGRWVGLLRVGSESAGRASGGGSGSAVGAIGVG